MQHDIGLHPSGVTSGAKRGNAVSPKLQIQGEEVASYGSREAVLLFTLEDEQDGHALSRRRGDFLHRLLENKSFRLYTNSLWPSVLILPALLTLSPTLPITRVMYGPISVYLPNSWRCDSVRGTTHTPSSDNAYSLGPERYRHVAPSDPRRRATRLMMTPRLIGEWRQALIYQWG